MPARRYETGWEIMVRFLSFQFLRFLMLNPF